MQAALIVMTILGCDDSATQCHYIDTVDQSWRTVAICDAQAEGQINRYQNSNYPVIVAVCESSGNRMTADIPRPDVPEETASLPAPDAAEAGDQPDATEVKGITSRTLALVRRALPDAAALKETVIRPVHSIEDGYSWVMRKFRN